MGVSAVEAACTIVLVSWCCMHVYILYTRQSNVKYCLVLNFKTRETA